MNIFVTSTGNKSGKTIFSAGIAAVMQSLGYEMAVFKPVQTNCKYANNKQFSPDLNFVKKVDPNIKTYSTFNFKQNTIPAVAADEEREKIKLEAIITDYKNAKKENDIIIVEGNGGVMTPITSKITTANIALTLNLPTVVVVNVEESDFINKTLMTINAAETYKLDIVGIVFNNYSLTSKQEKNHSEVKLLEQMLDYDVLGYIPNINFTEKDINPEDLISEILQNTDLQKVFNMEIPKLNF